MSSKSIVNIESILSNLESLTIIDARSGKDSEVRFNRAHLKGALHVDLDKDLTQKEIVPERGGRHPLPDLKDFSELLGRLGITPTTHVVVYDGKSGANAAARFWWMLRAAGHERVQVIDGGWNVIRENELPLSSEMEKPKSVPPYPIREWKLPTVSLADVEQFAKDPQHLVIDVREPYRYNGDSEPIDLVAGHIPGAINIPYLENLDEYGNFKSTDELGIKYLSVIGNRDPKNVIVHCGSGVTACHTLLAMEQAGITGASLYVGSWSEWSRNDKPIGKV